MSSSCCDCSPPPTMQTLVVVTAGARTTGESSAPPETVLTTAVNGGWGVSAGNLYVQQDSSAGSDAWNSSVGLDGDIVDVLDFRYKIPSWATITNISVTIWRAGSVSSTLKDKTVQLVVNGSPAGSNKAAATTYGTTLGFSGVIYSGDPVSYWGLASSPTADEVMAGDFGVRFQPQANSAVGSVTVSLDRVDMKITWSLSSGGEVYAMDENLNYGWIASLGTPPSFSSAWRASPALIDGDGNIYVRGEAQTASGPTKSQVQVRKFDKDGNYLWDWNSGDIPFGVTVQDGIQAIPLCFDLNGYILVPHKPTSSGNYFLTVLDSSGSVVTQFAYPGGGIPTINMTGNGPMSIGVDSANNYYIGTGAGTGFGGVIVLVLDSSGSYLNHVGNISFQSMIVDRVRDIIYYFHRVDADLVNPAPNSAIVVSAKDFSGGGNIGPAGGTATKTWTRSFSQIQSGLPTNSPLRSALPVNFDVYLLSGNIYGGALFMNSGGNTHVQLASNIYGLDSSGGVTWNARIAPTDYDAGTSLFNYQLRYSAVDQSNGNTFMLLSAGQAQGSLSAWAPAGSDHTMGFHLSAPGGAGVPVFGIAVRTF